MEERAGRNSHIVFKAYIGYEDIDFYELSGAK